MALLVFAETSPRLAAQSADFNAGTDSQWTHYSLPDYGAAKYTFPADDAGGKAYRIYAPPTGDDPWAMGNARAGSLRTDATYAGRFTVGADVLAWNAVWQQETGLLYYLSEVGLGTTDGYAATYSSAYRNLYITLIEDERDAGTVGELRGIALDPTHQYRLVVSSHDGSTLLFQLFDKVDLVNPWCSIVCEDENRTYASGFCGLFVWERTYPSSVAGAEATFDNYQAFLPTAGAMPATVTDLSPQPGGKAAAFHPTVSVTILDRDTRVDPSSISLALDGVWIPNASLTLDPLVRKSDNPGREEFSGATATYAITTMLPWGSRHTNQVAFADNTGTWQTNTWVWTSAYPYLPASSSLPVGSLNVRGFEVRMAQSFNNGADLPNTLERARQQLAVPPLIPVDLTTTSMVQVLSWDKTGTPANVPGLCPGSYNNIAVESLAYLELSAGVHRFRIRTDDRAGVYSGARFAAEDAQTLWENPGNTADSTFEFFVEAPGLYPVRTLWEETGGSAYHYLYSVGLDDLSEVPLNDPSDPTGVVRAWYPLVCRSSPAVAGPYTAEVKALNVVNKVDLVGSADCSPAVVGQVITGGTFTVPVSQAARFYVLDGPRPARITSFRRDGSNVTFTYQLQ